MSTPREASGSEFCLEGQFLALVVERGKVKYLRMALADQELEVKLSKAARASLFRLNPDQPSASLRPWDKIQVSGIQKLDRQTGQLKLKAHHICRCSKTVSTDLLFDLPCDLMPNLLSDSETNSASDSETNSASDTTLTPQPKPIYKILACRKSGCLKKGALQYCQRIAALLQDRGLDHVKIEQTGCLGKCSMAPNLILMPHKKRLSGMKPEAVVDWVEHLQIADYIPCRPRQIL